MRTYDLTPFYRSTVGFDRLFDLVDNGVRSDWPPYDIEKIGDDRYRISMAVAGFTQDDIEITQEGTNLTVLGRKNAPQDGKQFLHRGIANRSFKQAFSLEDHVKVGGAQLVNGMLEIELVQEVPEQLKPRRIEIGSGGGSSIGQSDPQKQIESETQAKAA
jgi:molecular chaperone IbpA